jgi:hypothetical protein
VSKRWRVRELSDEDIHVLPVNDLRVHLEIRTCWCKPTFWEAPDGELVIMHNSVDGRELIERHGLM